MTLYRYLSKYNESNLVPNDGMPGQSLVMGEDGESPTWGSPATLDLSIRDYVGLDAGGSQDTSTIINTASLAASNIAKDGGYPYVTLGGFGRGVYRIDSRLLDRDRVRLKVDEARIVAGAGFVTGSMYQAIEALAPAVAQGTGTTANGSYVITAVSAPTLWGEEDRITGTGIPANAKVVTVDLLNSRLVIDAPASANGTVTLTKAATYYGAHRNSGVSGGEWDPNERPVYAGFRVLYTDGFHMEHVRFLHNRGATDANWAFQMGGRNMVVNDVQCIGGHRVFEDGFHIMHGQHIQCSNIGGESGDDLFALGPADDTFLALNPDPIRHVTLNGLNGRSHRGNLFRIYVDDDGASIGRDWEITDIEASGLVGKTGILRNGGILIEDRNNGAAGTSQIKRVNVDGVKMDVGGKGHDDVNARGIWVWSAKDVRIANVTAQLTDGEGAAAGFDFAYIFRSADVELDNIRCDVLGARFGVDVVSSHRVTLKNSKLTQNLVSPYSNVPLRLSACLDFNAEDNEIRGLRTGQAALTCTTGTSTTAKFTRNKVAVAQSQTGYGFSVLAAAMDELIATDNDLRQLTADFDDLAQLRAIARYTARDNVGWPDRSTSGGTNGMAGIFGPTSRGWFIQAGVASNLYHRYYKVVPDRNMVIVSLGHVVTVAATNNDSVDFGLYDETLTKIISTGLTAGKCNATGAQSITITATTLKAGSTYYFAHKYGVIGGTAATIAVAATSALSLRALGATAGLIEAADMSAASGDALPTTLTIPSVTANSQYAAGILRET